LALPPIKEHGKRQPDAATPEDDGARRGDELYGVSIEPGYPG
jgi:hypothetical protein